MGQFHPDPIAHPLQFGERERADLLDWEEQQRSCNRLPWRICPTVLPSVQPRLYPPKPTAPPSRLLIGQGGAATGEAADTHGMEPDR
jgi:hypothetical protein